MEQLSTHRKSLALNQDDRIYGTFAEIGAGQEVARHFFKVGLASQTVAKTMSAYDMTFSDSIYGKGQRYVSKPRLSDMLSHEYELLLERLMKKRGQDSRFFAFANTVTTGSRNQEDPCRSHGWVGVRFQTSPQAQFSEIKLHVRMHDHLRLQQQEALGILGVNLIYGSYFLHQNPSALIASLNDNIGHQRIEIDFIEFDGEAFQQVDNRLMSLELIENQLTNAVLFDGHGQVQMASDHLYRKPLLLYRGTFRPITTANLNILQKCEEQLSHLEELKDQSPLLLTEISIQSLRKGDKIDLKDFLDRVDTLAFLGYHVMISNFTLFYQLKNHLRQCTDNFVSMIIGASHLEKIFDENYYAELPGGILNAFGQLFDNKTNIYVFPYKSEEICVTAQTFHPKPPLSHLFQYLLQKQSFRDILGCDDVDTSIRSSDVCDMLEKGDQNWEKHVPKDVVTFIKEKHLFGFSG